MDTSKKIIIGAVGTAVVIGAASIGLILGRAPADTDLSTIHTQAVSTTQETPAKTVAVTENTTTAESETIKETYTGINVQLETYTSGNISIQYPVVDQMHDTAKQDAVNERLKANALSIIQANDLDETKDTLTVKCEVISADRKRLTAVYKGDRMSDGAAYPVSVFYTNTMDLNQVRDLGLSDFTDGYTMAGYVLSDDVEFLGVNQEQKEAFLKYRDSLDMDILTEVFNGADFPLASETAWPESFSYESHGTICFSVPVPHALGDYVIVTFNPSTK